VCLELNYCYCAEIVASAGNNTVHLLIVLTCFACRDLNYYYFPEIVVSVGKNTVRQEGLYTTARSFYFCVNFMSGFLILSPAVILRQETEINSFD
jgi:hypothetical protein